MIRAGVLGVAGLLSALAATGEPEPRSCAAGACDPLCVDVGRYAVRGEIVVDLRDGERAWQRRASERLPHAEAARYCASLVLDGVGGFRLPSREELFGLRYKPGGLFGGGPSRHYCVPSIDQEAFPETPPAEFWTGSTLPDDTAWYVDFGDGRMHRDTRSDPLWVRCVHDAPQGAAPASSSTTRSSPPTTRAMGAYVSLSGVSVFWW